MKKYLSMDLKGKVLIFLVFMVLGFMLTVQYRVTEQAKSIRLQRVSDLSERLKQAELENAKLLKELEELRQENGKGVTSLELEELRILANLNPVEGPGIKVLLDDSNLNQSLKDNPNLYIIHDEDLLRVLNELRAAGAEAISINDQRITALSEVRCAGPTVSVNNVRTAPPYEIKAIGPAKTMTSSLRLRGGVVETFEFWGIQVKITKEDKLLVPGLKGVRTFEYATPVVEEGK